jgi:hypothetical protein
MVLYHKYNAEMKIHQYCKFQKALFVKIVPNLHFILIKGGNLNLFSIQSKSNFSIRNVSIYFNDYI